MKENAKENTKENTKINTKINTKENAKENTKKKIQKKVRKKMRKKLRKKVRMFTTSRHNFVSYRCLSICNYVQPLQYNPCFYRLYTKIMHTHNHMQTPQKRDSVDIEKALQYSINIFSYARISLNQCNRKKFTPEKNDRTNDT